MNRVQATPPLPYPDGKTLDELAQFDKDIRKALYQYLMSVATRLNGVLPKDGSEEATLLRVGSNTDISSLTQTDQPVQIGTYETVNMMIDGNEIQVRLNGFADILNLQLLGGSVRIGSVGGSITMDGTTIAKNIADNNIVISGGSSAGNGANIELYGGSHATNANWAVYDAALHVFRTQNGATLQALSAAGMFFPASQIASSDVNCLDDYEEGTWTPTLNFSGGTTGITYSIQTGVYVKIGQLVFVQGRIILTNKGSSTGAARIAGLPFTSNGASHNYTPISVGYFQNFVALPGALSGYVEIGNTFINLAAHQATGVGGLNETHFSNTSDIIFSAVYRATN